MGTTTRAGRIKAQSFTADRRGDLRGPSADSAPSDEAHPADRLLTASQHPPVPSPSIAVVCATHRRPSLLASLVEAVLDDRSVKELILVTDGHEGSLPVLMDLARSRPRLVPLQVEQVGHHAALDAAVAITSAEVLLLIDDDVLAGPGLAAAHAAHHARRNGIVVMGYMPVGAATAKRRPPARGAGCSIGTDLYVQAYEDHCHRIEAGELQVLDELWTGNISIRRADCVRIGLQSPRFTAHYHADTELGWRLSAAGLQGVFDRSLAAGHLHARSPREFLRDGERQGASRALLHDLEPQRRSDLDPGAILAGLPGAARFLVRSTGRSPFARPVAHMLLGTGRLVGRVRWSTAETALAKLARRVMQVRGAWSVRPQPADRQLSRVSVTARTAARR